MILPWHQAIWLRLSEIGPRSHHALLLAGPAGGGKRLFAEALAAARLCDAREAAAGACGQCESCVWLAAGTHPDFMRLVAESDEASEAAETEKEGPRSRLIRVEQIRSVQEALMRKGHRSERRVVLIDPAEAMTAVTANGLLKLLEEPPSGVLFLIVSAAPERLMATIVSRAQRWNFPQPPREQALAWLQHSGIAQAETYLDFSGGMPLAAKSLASGALAPLRQRFVKDLCALPQRDPLGLAAEWDAWLKSKEALAAGLDMSCLADWLLRWYADLALLAQGAAARYFRDAESAMRQLLGAASGEAALACYTDGLQLRRLAAHPLNARLLLEDTLLRYWRHIAPRR